jgi:hypothetical protein
LVRIRQEAQKSRFLNLLFLFIYIINSPDAHYHEVVVRFGAVAMAFYFSLQRFNNLLSSVDVGVSKDAEQIVITKQLLLPVLSLIQSVGIYKQGSPLHVFYLLALVWHIAYYGITPAFYHFFASFPASAVFPQYTLSIAETWNIFGL